MTHTSSDAWEARAREWSLRPSWAPQPTVRPSFNGGRGEEGGRRRREEQSGLENEQERKQFPVRLEGRKGWTRKAHSIFSFSILVSCLLCFKIYLLYLIYFCRGACVSRWVGGGGGGQRIFYRSQVSPSAMWAWGGTQVTRLCDKQFYRFLFILCTWMFYLYVFSFNACMPGACGGHKRESSCCSKQLLAAVWCWRLEPDPLEEQLLSHSPTPGAGTCAQLDPVCVFPRTTDTRVPTAWFYVVLQMRPGLWTNVPYPQPYGFPAFSFDTFEAGAFYVVLAVLELAI